MHRTIAALLVAAAGCGGGTDGTPATPPTAVGPTPVPTSPRVPEQSAPPEPPIEITPVGRGISVTSENQILLELMPEDLDPANPLDLAGKTLVFTPDARGGYARSVRALDWEEDHGDPADEHEVELSFPFAYAGRSWRSFFPSERGMITFGGPSPYRDERYIDRWGTMQMIASRLTGLSMVSPLLKSHLGGRMLVSSRADRAVVTWQAWDAGMRVYGRRPSEGFNFQLVLHSDGSIQFNYGPQPEDPDEAFLDGIVGLFGLDVTRTERIARVADPVDPSVPAHLDLREIAFYRTSDPGIVLVEFTTRGPIHPVPGRQWLYILFLDTDRPWWRDRERERDDGDLWWYVALHPDGRLDTGGDGTIAPAPFGAGDNRIGFLIPLSEYGSVSASIAAGSAQKNSEGAWDGPGNRPASPVVVEFPDVGAPVDLSRPDSRPSTAQTEVFRYVMIRDRDEGIAEVSCRIVEVLGDEFDFMAFNSEFRVDMQAHAGPGHGFAGFYPGNVAKLVTGIGADEDDDRAPPCDSDRLTNTWGFPVWMKGVGMKDLSGDLSTAYDRPLTVFAHEIGHTWLAAASYLKDGERKILTASGAHWALELHAPAPFPWRGEQNGSVMGGAYWRENADGTFSATSGWSSNRGAFSWLDLYLMGLATPDEVPDMFILSNLRREGPCTFQEEFECERFGPFAADKEVVTMEQVIAALGPRNPPPERSRKVFNTGFVYFLLPGQEPDPELLREHARYRDRALEHWSHVTGGRGQLTSELPGRQ